MKLAILAISMALALPSAISAQGSARDTWLTGREMFGAVSIDPNGVSIATSAGYTEGTAVFLFGLSKAVEGEGLLIPAALGGGEVLIQMPLGDPLFNQCDQLGNSNIRVGFNTQLLANLRLTAYVQVFSLDSSDWPDVPVEPGEDGPPPILISRVMTIDFAEGLQEWAEVQTAPSGDAGSEEEGAEDVNVKRGDDVQDEETIR